MLEAKKGDHKILKGFRTPNIVLKRINFKMVDKNVAFNYSWLALGLGVLLVLGIAAHYAFPNEVEGEKVDIGVYSDLNYTDLEAKYEDLNASINLVQVEEEKCELSELEEEILVRETAVKYFLTEWKEEFEFDVEGINLDYEDVREELGFKINLEDYPNYVNSMELLDEVEADKVDIKDNEWEIYFTVEFEVGGEDYEYDVFMEIEASEECTFEADNLELMQLMFF